MIGRRLGEIIMMASGIGIAIGGALSGMMFLTFSGLAIAGLGVISVFWR